MVSLGTHAGVGKIAVTTTAARASAAISDAIAIAIAIRAVSFYLELGVALTTRGSPASRGAGG